MKVCLIACKNATKRHSTMCCCRSRPFPFIKQCSCAIKVLQSDKFSISPSDDKMFLSWITLNYNYYGAIFFAQFEIHVEIGAAKSLAADVDEDDCT